MVMGCPVSELWVLLLCRYPSPKWHPQQHWPTCPEPTRWHTQAKGWMFLKTTACRNQLFLLALGKTILYLVLSCEERSHPVIILLVLALYLHFLEHLLHGHATSSDSYFSSSNFGLDKKKGRNEERLRKERKTVTQGKKRDEK